MAIAEFVNLLNSGFEAEVATILIGPGSKLRDRLLPRPKDVKEGYRERLRKGAVPQRLQCGGSRRHARRSSTLGPAVRHHLSFNPMIGLLQAFAQRLGGLPAQFFLDKAVI
jgi:hypothetical protein